METPRLRRSLFGYSRKGVRALLAEREAMAITAAADAREAEERVQQLSDQLEESRRETAELQARTRDLDAQLTEATERFRVLDQSGSPHTNEGLTEVLHAAERALGRLTQSARRNAEQELGLTERARDELRAEIDRLAAWRDQMLPLSESVPESIEEVRRETSAIAGRLREALGPVNDAMEVLAARLSKLAGVSPAPPEVPGAGDVIGLGDADADTGAEVPPAPQGAPSVLASPRSTLEDPKPEPQAPAPERRMVGAGRAFVTMLVCLGLWALLFAPVLERRAETGPVGARRTVALVVLRALGALSDALELGTASELVSRALGRDPDAPPGGELELPDLSLAELPQLDLARDPPRPSPQDAAASPSPAGPPDRDGEGDRGREELETPIGIRTPTEDAKLRVVVVGDSLSQGLGPAIAQLFDPDVSRVLPLGRQSTGLARQDYFDWQSAMRKIEEEFRPDLLFVLLGSNDNQDQVTPDGDEVEVGSLEWVESYHGRAAALLHEATSNGTRVVWVGIPVVREHQRWDFYRRVNQIYRNVAAADPLATYVDAWKLFQARDGDYTAYLRNEWGLLQEMRAGDGIHFTPNGYGYLAREAIRAAADAFELPQDAVTFQI